MVQYNKHRIRIASNDKERKQMKIELQKSNFKEYVELVNYEFDEEVKITIQNHVLWYKLRWRMGGYYKNIREVRLRE